MVSFRRIILALTVLALFAGLASAQVGGQQQMTCATNVSVTPTLRAEGYTEQGGDVTLTCSGGANLTQGSQIPQVNIQIFLNTQVTSRLFSTGPNVSEALLLIDEPGSGLAGVGPSLPQKLCPTPTSGCIEYVSTQVGTTPAGLPTGSAVDGCAVFNLAGVCTTTSSTFGANVFQGIVTGNSVTFFGIPVLPPVTSGASRVYRVTNVRANATTLSGGSAAGATPLIASISISGATSLLITNPTPTIGFVQPGLSPAASGTTNLNQCNTQTRAAISVLSFTENFGTAFKTRVAAQSNTLYAGQIVTANQNIPGTIYNSESNFVFPISSTQVAGLADFGTRLKATFNNIPAGASLFVSTTAVQNAALPVPLPNVIGGSAANTGSQPAVQLVNGESTPDGNGVTGFFPSIASTDTVGAGNTPVVQIPVVNGSATAVWEVVNTNPNAIETVRVGVYISYGANVAQNSPLPGLATVNLSFAPTPTAAFTAAAGSVASNTLPIPRFVQDSAAARNIVNINICRTILLYPYVTNIQGFDTGLAISNTSTDPFNTGAQTGACSLNWYQGATNPAVGTSGAIASGTVYTTLASMAVPGFNGYMIAVCNFQYAHGFAFISDLGARNLAMGYLALIIPDPGTGSRNASPPCQGIAGCTASGEQEGH